MTRARRFVRDITRLDKSAFSLSIGVRAAIFTVVPLLLAILIDQPTLLFVTIGALFLANTEGQPSLLPGWVLLVACFTEATAFGLGTLVATTGPIISIILIAVAVSIALVAHGSPRWASVGTFTAIMFVIGVGLPDSSVQVAGVRAYFSLAGCL